MHGRPSRIVCQSTSTTVCFQVGFVHDVHAQPVAKFVPARVVRVVGSADCVNVGPLHQKQVFAQLFEVHRVTGERIVLVAIDTTKNHGLAVYEDSAIAYFDLAEPNIARHDLLFLSIFIGKCQH